eukprot:gnl/TRDRNA2_/TRDRNA2_125604_c0_seq1.p1 gnl/TRDRNA2_/TRDRNA2_125604_c0~~gnl/TRDRNA2_/TRDRNA2_125604_c0_seq1.p1  ORF type:complete len:335 (-),score=69.10 gnl/TRDRNA2_/TRDRNA2_125604_c0_seq1:114-1118(-)
MKMDDDARGSSIVKTIKQKVKLEAEEVQVHQDAVLREQQRIAHERAAADAATKAAKVAAEALQVEALVACLTPSSEREQPGQLPMQSTCLPEQCRRNSDAQRRRNSTAGARAAVLKTLLGTVEEAGPGQRIPSKKDAPTVPSAAGRRTPSKRKPQIPKAPWCPSSRVPDKLNSLASSSPPYWLPIGPDDSEGGGQVYFATGTGGTGARYEMLQRRPGHENRSRANRWISEHCPKGWLLDVEKAFWLQIKNERTRAIKERNAMLRNMGNTPFDDWLAHMHQVEEYERQAKIAAEEREKELAQRPHAARRKEAPVASTTNTDVSQPSRPSRSTSSK